MGGGGTIWKAVNSSGKTVRKKGRMKCKIFTFSVKKTTSKSPSTAADIPTTGPFTKATRGFGKSMKLCTKFLKYMYIYIY